MNIREWYGGYKIPSGYGDGYGVGPSYASFVVSCMGLVSAIVKRTLDRQVHVVFDAVETAAADPAKGQIIISHHFYEGRFQQGKPRLKVEDAITALLGVVIHEAGHIAWSPQDRTAWADGLEKPFSLWLIGEIGNIVEDVYIEQRIRREVPNFGWMLDGINDIVFPPETLAQMEVVEPPATEEDPRDPATRLGQILNFLLLAKMAPRPVWLDATEDRLLAELWDDVETVHEMDSKRDRIDLCQRIYRKLADDSEEMAALMSKLAAGGEEEKDAVKKGQVPDLLGDVGKPKKVPEKLSEEVLKVDRLLRQIAEGDLDVEASKSEYGAGNIIVHRRVLPASDGRVSPNKQYADLAAVARARASANRPYGEAQKRGHDLRRIHNIATTGKIFAERIEFPSMEPLECIVFVDASGSMGGVVGGGYYGKTKILASLEAACGAAAGLANGRAKVAVWAHSGDINGAHVVLYRLKGWNEGLDVMMGRSHALANNVGGGLLYQNRDGDAIAEVAKEFKDRKKRQVLIVISDGEPCAGGYSGGAAVAHSNKVVNRLRSKGVKVLSISIDNDAVETNNQIYGSENNLVSDDPNAISVIARQLIG